MIDKPKITPEQVRDIAELAKLELTDSEVDMYTRQLAQILDYFTLLEELDTSHIQPTDSVLPLRNVLRDDTPAAPLKPETATKNAPEAEANQFKVSAVLGE